MGASCRQWCCQLASDAAAAGAQHFPRSSKHAVAWQNGVAKELRLLTDQAAALAGTWMTASGINDMGAIVGGTEYARGSHAFIAVPKR
jgi:uncharacterized membrane protein